MINCLFCNKILIDAQDPYRGTTQFYCLNHIDIFIDDNRIKGFNIYKPQLFQLLVGYNKFFFNHQLIDSIIEEFSIQSFNERIIPLMKKMKKYLILV